MARSDLVALAAYGSVKRLQRDLETAISRPHETSWRS